MDENMSIEFNELQNDIEVEECLLLRRECYRFLEYVDDVLQVIEEHFVVVASYKQTKSLIHLHFSNYLVRIGSVYSIPLANSATPIKAKNPRNRREGDEMIVSNLSFPRRFEVFVLLLAEFYLYSFDPMHLINQSYIEFDVSQRISSPYFEFSSIHSSDPTM